MPFTEEQPPEQQIAPILGPPPDFEEEDDDGDDEEYEDEQAPHSGVYGTTEHLAERVAARKKKRGKKQPQTQATIQARTASMAMDYDEWIQQFNFELPGCYTKLYRIAPEHWEGQQCGGELEHRDGAAFSTKEIHERFGGGHYEIRMYGPRKLGDKFKPQLGRKQFRIAGPPNLAELTKDQRAVAARTGATPAAAAMAAGADPSMIGLSGQAQAGMIGLVQDQMKWTREQANKASPGGFDRQFAESLTKPYEASQAVIQEAAEARVRASTEAAEREVKLTRERLNQMQQEIDRERKDTERRVAEAGAASNTLMTTLLPNIWQNAREQTADVVKATDQQLARVEASHKGEVESLHRFYQTQIDNQKTLYGAQFESLKSTYQNQITLLQQQLQLATAKIEMLDRECAKSRDDIMNMHREAAAKQDPVKRIEELGTLQELIKGLAGNDGGGDDLGEDASPALKLLHGALPMLNNFSEVIKQKFTGAGGASAQQPDPAAQQQMQMQQHQQMLMQRQQMMQRQQVAAKQRQLLPKPVKKPTRLKREDLESAVSLINGAFTAGVEAELLAERAVGSVDNSMLKALAVRNPDKVIAELINAGILTGQIAEPGVGQTYVVTFLTRLKQLLMEPAPSEVPQAEAAE